MSAFKRYDGVRSINDVINESDKKSTSSGVTAVSLDEPEISSVTSPALGSRSLSAAQDDDVKSHVTSVFASDESTSSSDEERGNLTSLEKVRVNDVSNEYDEVINVCDVRVPTW
jgi:purine-nucleoside phosphorylase